MSDGPNDSDALLEKSIEHLNLNDSTQAEVFARQSLRADPDNLRALSALGLALHSQAKYRESEQAYLRMTELEPSESMHWMNVGTAQSGGTRRQHGRFLLQRRARSYRPGRL
jgi:Flp pilus assembly protein TadD